MYLLPNAKVEYIYCSIVILYKKRSSIFIELLFTIVAIFLFFLAITVAAHEFIHASCSVNKFRFTCVKRMRCT